MSAAHLNIIPYAASVNGCKMKKGTAALKTDQVHFSSADSGVKKEHGLTVKQAVINSTTTHAWHAAFTKHLDYGVILNRVLL